MKNFYFISRNFVEFGPFFGEEIVNFNKRQVLTDHDYIRSQNGHNWETVAQWIAEGSPAKTTAKKKASAPAKKKISAQQAGKHLD